MLALFSSNLGNESESKWNYLELRQRVRCTIILTPTGDFTSLNICKRSKDHGSSSGLSLLPYNESFHIYGVRQMQTADLQTRAWASQTRTSVSQTSAAVSQTSTPVRQTSTSVRLFRLDGIGNTIYNLPVCSLQSAYVAHRHIYWFLPFNME